jgi:hypothetical protein
MILSLKQSIALNVKFTLTSVVLISWWCLGCVFVTTDKGMDFRVCTAGIRWILGFAQLELASVPEKLSLTNFCFCDCPHRMDKMP